MERGPGNWPEKIEAAYRECRDKLDRARKEAEHWRDNHKTLKAEVERIRAQTSSPEAVYVVQHSYEIDECAETKFIGVYRSRAAAGDAVERLKTVRGFREYPDDFHVDEYRLDQDHWVDGFVSD
jgi:hypothetical protein